MVPFPPPSSRLPLAGAVAAVGLLAACAGPAPGGYPGGGMYGATGSQAQVVTGGATAPGGPGAAVVASPGTFPTAAPPNALQENMGVAPSASHVWIPGNWNWAGGRYAWQGGHWEPNPGPGYVWVPKTWQSTPGGWRETGGHWILAQPGMAVQRGPGGTATVLMPHDAR